jgi:hypothetical protein
MANANVTSAATATATATPGYQKQRALTEYPFEDSVTESSQKESPRIIKHDGMDSWKSGGVP